MKWHLGGIDWLDRLLSPGLVQPFGPTALLSIPLRNGGSGVTLCSTSSQDLPINHPSATHLKGHHGNHEIYPTALATRELQLP